MVNIFSIIGMIHIAHHPIPIRLLVKQFDVGYFMTKDQGGQGVAEAMDGRADHPGDHDSISAQVFLKISVGLGFQNTRAVRPG